MKDMEESVRERIELAELLTKVLDREKSGSDFSDEQLKSIQSLLASLSGKAVKAGA